MKEQNHTNPSVKNFFHLSSYLLCNNSYITCNTLVKVCESSFLDPNKIYFELKFANLSQRMSRTLIIVFH